MKNILANVDKLLRIYLGLGKEETTPHFVKKRGSKLIILNTESYKRHAKEVLITKTNLSAMNNENKEKLGVAIGKIIATNLVISFEEIVIQRENAHAG